MPIIVKPILIRYGGAAKSSFSMNAIELDVVALSILRRAREKAFSKGLPIYYVDKGKLVAEYSDGHTKVVKPKLIGCFSISYHLSRP